MWLDGLVPTGITAVSLVTLLYISQLKGWVYFKPQVDELRADRDKRIEAVEKDRDARVAEARSDADQRVADARDDRDARVRDKERENAYLWEALNLSETGRRTVVAQQERILEGLETTARVVQAIPVQAPPTHTGE